MHVSKCTLVFTALAATVLAAGKPNFAGEWKLNVQRSDFGGRPAPTSATLKIEHNDPSLNVSRTIVTSNGEITSEAVYSTDGKPTTNKLPRGGEMTNTAKWDGTALVIQTPVNVNGNKFTIDWKWTLSDDGRVLTTVRTFGPGEPPQTEVYEKK